MKNSNKLYNWLITTFILLYSATALISTFHAFEFFQIGNVLWMSIVLAITFEIGQASVLLSLLMTDNKNKILPWFVMIILTSIQCIGNVYSVFKFMSVNNLNYFVYLQKPLLFWIPNLNEEMVMIIISWIIGALLPIIALMLTSMVANNINLKLANNNSLGLLETNKNDVIISNSDKDKIMQSNNKEEDISSSLDNKKSSDKLLDDILNEIPIKKENKKTPQLTMNNGGEYISKIINGEEVILKK